MSTFAFVVFVLLIINSYLLQNYGFCFYCGLPILQNVTQVTTLSLPNWGAGPNLGATRPRVGIANLGLDAPSWQYMKY